MNLSLEGQTVVIVGGAHGIGWSIAREFYEEGCHVAILDIAAETPSKTQELAGGVDAKSKTAAPSVRGWCVDITDERETNRVFQEVLTDLGDFRHVVVAAGIGSGKFGFPYWNLQPRDWKRVLEVNLLGVVNVAHACCESIRSKPDGSITLLASVAGQIGSQTDPPYSAAKAGVINFGQCMAKDLAPFGIRVNTICPGMVQTDLNRSVWQAWNDQQAADQQRDYEDWADEKVARVVPLGRWQTPADIAGLAVYLASPRARNITGQTLNVDGGFVMHW